MIKLETKYKIISAFSTVCFLLAVWYWWRYTQRRFWGFIGYSLLGSIIGASVGGLVMLPFRDEPKEDTEMEEEPETE